MSSTILHRLIGTQRRSEAVWMPAWIPTR